MINWINEVIKFASVEKHNIHIGFDFMMCVWVLFTCVCVSAFYVEKSKLMMDIRVWLSHFLSNFMSILFSISQNMQFWWKTPLNNSSYPLKMLINYWNCKPVLSITFNLNTKAWLLQSIIYISVIYLYVCVRCEIPISWTETWANMIFF